MTSALAVLFFTGGADATQDKSIGTLIQQMISSRNNAGGFVGSSLY